MRTPRIHLAIAAVLAVGGAVLVQPRAQDAKLPAPDAGSAGKGFRFLGGNLEGGKEAFAKLNCIQCHTVKGVEVPAPKGKRRLNLQLGGEVRFVKQYEDVVLAITNPRHVVTKQYQAILSQAELEGEIEAFMPNLIDHMSARQLIDLVTFLDDAYEKAQPTYGKKGE